MSSRRAGKHGEDESESYAAPVWKRSVPNADDMTGEKAKNPAAVETKRASKADDGPELTANYAFAASRTPHSSPKKKVELAIPLQQEPSEATEMPHGETAVSGNQETLPSPEASGHSAVLEPTRPGAFRVGGDPEASHDEETPVFSETAPNLSADDPPLITATLVNEQNDSPSFGPIVLAKPLRRRQTCIVVAVVLVIIVVVLSVLVTQLAETSPETNNTDSSPTSLTPMECFNQSLDLFGSVSDEADLENGGTPQSKAIKWLAFNDTADYCSDDTDLEMLMERYVTTLLYFATNGVGWKKQYKFLSNSSVCAWNDGALSPVLPKGIRCSDGTRVVKIQLDSNGLSGTIPAEVGVLSELKILALHINKLSGTVPTEIESLSKLHTLSLSANDLSGSLPFVCRMNSLKISEADCLPWFGNVQVHCGCCNACCTPEGSWPCIPV